VQDGGAADQDGYPNRIRQITSCSRLQQRQSNGSSITELVATLVPIAPFILVLIDCGMIAIGVALNGFVCRDAARASASGPPGDLTVGTNRTVSAGKDLYDRAIAVIKRLYATNLPVKVRETIIASETVRIVPPPMVGGAVDGAVNVQTTIDVYPPFLVGGIVGAGGIALKSSHRVPFTYVVLNTTAEEP
jgi:hypothetical protein